MFLEQPLCHDAMKNFIDLSDTSAAMPMLDK